MKKLLTRLVFIGLLFSTQTQAINLLSIQKGIKIIAMFNQLAEHYQLSGEQKSDIQHILFNELPNAMPFVTELMDNRHTLMFLATENNGYDEPQVKELALAQGQLITQLIIWKESLKYSIRLVLDKQQQVLVDELLEYIISQRPVTLSEH